MSKWCRSPQLRVEVHFLAVEHRRRLDVRRLQRVHDVVVVALRCPLRDRRIEFVAVIVAREQRRKALVVEPLRVVHGARQALELGVVRAGDHRPAIVAGAAVAPLRHGVVAAVADALLQAAGHLVFQQGRAHHGNRRLLFGQIDVLALAGAAAVLQRRQHRPRADEAGVRVREREPGAHRRAAVDSR